MPREVLVHLNVTVPDGDDRSAEEIGNAVYDAFDVGSDDEAVSGLDVTLALIDEVG